MGKSAISRQCLTTAMLHIHLGSISETNVELNTTVQVDQFRALIELTRESDVAFSGPIGVSVRAVPSGDAVAIEGHAEVEVRLTCSRCLIRFDQRIESDFSATAIPKENTPAIDAADEVELSVEDMDIIEFEGDSVDLNEEIAQQILMALPFNPLCRASCKGLCSRCGADLNHAACGCETAENASPFAVLKALSFPAKKE